LTPNIPRRRQPKQAPHERPPDPAEAADRPLEPKTKRPEEPGDDPHHSLNKPLGEPDATADSDPYEPHPEDEDPPPPGRFPGPGPEPEE
jgi:hypothetical protein